MKRKTVKGIKSNSKGQFKGNYNNQIVIATTEEDKPTEESIFTIISIARINGKVTRILSEVFCSDITFFNILI